MRRFITLLSLLSASSGCLASDWNQEPTSVLGFEIGKSLSQKSTPDCPQSEWLKKYKQIDSFCVWHGIGKPGTMLVHGLEKIPLSSVTEGEVFSLQGKTVALSLKFQPQNFERMAEVLSSKYGPPSRTSERSVRSAMTGLITSRQYNWDGKSISIYMREHGKSVFAGQVDFYSNEAAGALSTDRAIEIKNDASKL